MKAIAVLALLEGFMVILGLTSIVVELREIKEWLSKRR